MKKTVPLLALLLWTHPAFCWGFFAHRQINHYATFLLPPSMIAFYKPNIDYVTEHAIDPDKRRYAVPEEGARHYIDIDHYGAYPFTALPRRWQDAVARYSEDTLRTYGIVPWWTQVMLARLTEAFSEKNGPRILQLSAELGHYVADLHVPLHVCSNHNGQLTDQQGIHAFWESRLPELLADDTYDRWLGQATVLPDAGAFLWKRVLESAAAADTVLRLEKQLAQQFAPDQRFAYEVRSGVLVRQYSTAYAKAYDRLLNGMVERRYRQSVFAVASCWYTAWVSAGQPALDSLQGAAVVNEGTMSALDAQWRKGQVYGRACD